MIPRHTLSAKQTNHKRMKHPRKKHVNEIKQNRLKTSGQSEISTLKFSKQSDKTANKKIDREN